MSIYRSRQIYVCVCMLTYIHMALTSSHTHSDESAPFKHLILIVLPVSFHGFGYCLHGPPL